MIPPICSSTKKNTRLDSYLAAKEIIAIRVDRVTMQWNYLFPYPTFSSDIKKTSYLFPNLKHLLCFTSVILGLEVSCFFVCLPSESFSIAFMNLRKCLMYSGYVSRLQWPPPLTHKGSYFSLESSHKRFPWDQSTISSSVPCKIVRLNMHHQWQHTDQSNQKQPFIREQWEYE